MKVLITTVPFASENTLPRELLDKEGINYLVNPLNKKLTEDELLGMVKEFDIIIAGTEPISKKVIEAAENLKFISRVGIGLDSVDLLSCKDKNILVSYTPDAPAPAVAELTTSLAIYLLRKVHLANKFMHEGKWNRFYGKRISECTIGIIGVGRIGSKLIENLSGFKCKKILLNDIDNKNQHKFKSPNIEWVEKDRIYSDSDVISLHVPLTKNTHNMISLKELKQMKNDSVIINTSRGGIVNEHDLYYSLKNNFIAGAAIDVFEDEPYSGNLTDLDNCILTSHMGSMSYDCRSTMEIEATKEAIRFIKNKKLCSIVPEDEYTVQEEF